MMTRLDITMAGEINLDLVLYDLPDNVQLDRLGEPKPTVVRITGTRFCATVDFLH